MYLDVETTLNILGSKFLL